MRTLTLVVLLVGAVAAQSPPPQFRASVDLMRIDVTVLDKRTRTPVRGLKADDFEVKVGGTVQPIQAVAEVETRSRTSRGTAWQTTAGRDVVANDASANRLIVIVMDDSPAGLPSGLWNRQAGKRVAHRIIDELGPEDLAAVVFANKTEFSQDFTNDRSLLRAAVESFDPLANARFAYPDTEGTIRNVRMFLARVAGYRRAIMVVTRRGPPPAPPGTPKWAWVENAGLWDKDPDGTESPGFVAASRLSHVPIYFFATFGLSVSTNPAGRRPGDELAALARRTGGRAIIENNAPETEVASVMDELGSIYTLAYAPTFPFDGKIRFADIKVNRSDVIVLPSSGAFRTAREVDEKDLLRYVNVTKEPLSMSGVAIGRGEGRPIGGRETLSALLRFAPTVVREFAASDHVGAVVRVHQATGRAVALRLETQIMDAGGAVVVSHSTPFNASAFAEGRGVEHRYELPLTSLAPGEYLMRFVATAGSRHVTRDVRFSIR